MKPSKPLAATPVAPHALTGTRSAQTDLTMGVVLMLIFAAFAPIIDVFAKFAAAEAPAAEITFARFAVQSVLLLPIVIWRKALVRVPLKDAALHGLRGVLMAIATVFFIAALKYMPIADAIAIFFVEPMIVTVLSGLLLGEPVGWRRYAASAVGFCGALLVIQPSFVELGWTSALPLGTAFTFAFYLILTRMLAPRVDPFAMQTYSGLSGALFIGIVLIAADGSGYSAFDPIWPSSYALGLMIGVGVAATISHLFLVYAFRYAPASSIAPLQYLEIVSATLFGYWFFGDFPAPLKWVGVAIVIGSGLFIIARERRASKATG